MSIVKMGFESPKHSWRKQGKASLISNYGTSLSLRRPLSPNLTPTEKTEVVTFLSPKLSSAVWRKSTIGVTRNSDKLSMGVEKEDVSGIKANKSLNQYLDDTIFYRDINDKKRSLKRGSWEYYHLFTREQGIKQWSHFPDLSIKKRRRIGSFLGVSATSATDQLHHSYKMIDHSRDLMNRILGENWDYKRKYWISHCHQVLWSVLLDSTQLVNPCSGIIPKTLHSITMLSEADKHWYHVLISSARVCEIKSPDFSELTYDPQSNRGLDEEFEFQIKFQIGYDVEELAWYIHNAIGWLLMDEVCNLTAEYMGHSKFTCDVQIYFKKLVKPWWE